MSSAISATGSTGATAGAATRGFDELTSDDFMKIMLAELTNQDPLEPTSNQDLLNQISSIRSLESESAMVDAIRDLRSSQQLAGAGGLIGKHVSGLTATGDPVDGTVDRVRMVDGEVVLRLADGAEVPFDRVIEISESPQTTTGGGAV